MLNGAYFKKLRRFKTGVICTISATLVIWIVSVIGVFMVDVPRVRVGLLNGNVTFWAADGFTWGIRGAVSPLNDWLVQPKKKLANLDWLPECRRFEDRIGVFVPVWIPSLFLVIVLGVISRLQTQYCKRNASQPGAKETE